MTDGSERLLPSSIAIQEQDLELRPDLIRPVGGERDGQPLVGPVRNLGRDAGSATSELHPARTDRVVAGNSTQIAPLRLVDRVGKSDGERSAAAPDDRGRREEIRNRVELEAQEDLGLLAVVDAAGRQQHTILGNALDPRRPRCAEVVDSVGQQDPLVADLLENPSDLDWILDRGAMHLPEAVGRELLKTCLPLHAGVSLQSTPIHPAPGTWHLALRRSI